MRPFGASHDETGWCARERRPAQFRLQGIGDGLFAGVGRFARFGGEMRAVPRTVAQGEHHTGGVAVVFTAAFVHRGLGFERASGGQQGRTAEEEEEEERKKIFAWRVTIDETELF